MISHCMNKTPEKFRSGTAGGFFSVLKIEKNKTKT